MNTKAGANEVFSKGRSVGAFFRRAVLDQSGQTLPLIALGMLAFLGVAGLAIDVGYADVVKAQLQNSTNAAALAAAVAIFSNDSAAVNVTSQADLYGATGTENPDSYVTAPPVVQKICMNILEPTGVTCSASSSPNAVRVTQTATLKTFFMGIFGIPTLTVTTTATASTLGGASQPWNVAIILDATGSMNSADPNCGSGMTEFGCATQAIQNMLAVANPCPLGASTCTTANANLHISLFSFPGISTATVANDTTSCKTPSFMAYTLPSPTSTSYSPLTYSEPSGKSGSTNWNGTYGITSFLSDYYSSTSSNSLNSSSALVSAISGCMSPIAQANSATGGLNGAPGSTNGGVTYAAPAIYAAQDALFAEQQSYPGSKNAIILLSDGQSNMPASANDLPSEQNSTLSSGSGYSAPTGTGIYPDTNDECQQAIAAAQAAAAAGTRVYAVAYGAESQGCSYTVGTRGSSGSYGTDNTTVVTGGNDSFTAATITPCITMENIASSLAYFYSDYNQSDAGTGVDKNCIDNSHPVSSLQDILLSVVSDFLHPRLLPNNAPYVITTSQ